MPRRHNNAAHHHNYSPASSDDDVPSRPPPPPRTAPARRHHSSSSSDEEGDRRAPPFPRRRGGGGSNNSRRSEESRLRYSEDEDGDDNDNDDEGRRRRQERPVKSPRKSSSSRPSAVRQQHRYEEDDYTEDYDEDYFEHAEFEYADSIVADDDDDDFFLPLPVAAEAVAASYDVDIYERESDDVGNAHAIYSCDVDFSSCYQHLYRQTKMGGKKNAHAVALRLRPSGGVVNDYASWICIAGILSRFQKVRTLELAMASPTLPRAMSTLLPSLASLSHLHDLTIRCMQCDEPQTMQTMFDFMSNSDSLHSGKILPLRTLRWICDQTFPKRTEFTIRAPHLTEVQLHVPCEHASWEVDVGRAYVVDLSARVVSLELGTRLRALRLIGPAFPAIAHSQTWDSIGRDHALVALHLHIPVQREATSLQYLLRLKSVWELCLQVIQVDSSSSSSRRKRINIDVDSIQELVDRRIWRPKRLIVSQSLMSLPAIQDLIELVLNVREIRKERVLRMRGDPSSSSKAPERSSGDVIVVTSPADGDGETADTAARNRAGTKKTQHWFRELSREFGAHIIETNNQEFEHAFNAPPQPPPLPPRCRELSVAAEAEAENEHEK